jgi:hypothetical protein
VVRLGQYRSDGGPDRLEAGVLDLRRLHGRFGALRYLVPPAIARVGLPRGVHEDLAAPDVPDLDGIQYRSDQSRSL